jgi:hypothetical protein
MVIIHVRQPILTSLRNFTVNERLEQSQQALSRIEDIENNVNQVLYFMRRAYVAHCHCNHDLRHSYKRTQRNELEGMHSRSGRGPSAKATKLRVKLNFMY